MALLLLCVGASAFVAPTRRTRPWTAPLESKDNAFMDAVGTKLKAKSARLASRRAAIVEEARERAASGEVYKGDGLLLDGKLDDDDGAPRVAEVLASLAKTCVEESTGVGEESSGDGRYAWGTWVDTDKVAAVVACADGVALAGDEALWSETLCGDFAAVRLAEGASWDVTLRRWTGDGGDVVQIFPPGSHVLLKPLRGTIELQKLRRGRDGEFAALGPKKELRGASAGLGGSAACGPVARVLGGPPQRLTARPGPTAVLEVVLRPPTGAADEGKAALDADTVVADLDDARWAPLRDALVAAGDADAEENPEEAGETPEEAASAPTAATATNLRENVGGLEEQLDAIVRRVLASRADPEGARRLGVSHVRGVLLSGPPGCGKTLLARELARELGARAPQIVNGPEILDKFVGEAERKVRDLFQPAEDEYRQVGDASALHVIVFDEMDAIARRRGSLTGDTTGVRDGVVNQLLAKLDGVVAAPNVLVVGCTNRPELIDEALLRPGRLEIQLVVDRPDAAGRRAIARIHTRQMRENGALAADAAALVEDGGAAGLAARTELFSGAELAGLVRAAASFALQRPEKTVTEADLDRALREVRPAAATAGAALEARLDRGFAADLACQAGARRRLARSVDAALARPGVRSLLLVPDVAGCGATALASKAARDAVRDERAGAAELASADDLLRDGARPGAALAAAFATAAAAEASILVLDDVDALVGGDGSALAVLRALCRRPPPPGNRLLVLATAAAPGVDAALDACFDEVLRVPRLGGRDDAAKVLDAAGVDVAALGGVPDAPAPIKALLRAADAAAAADPADAAAVFADALEDATRRAGPR